MSHSSLLLPNPNSKKIRTQCGLVLSPSRRPPVGLLGGWGRANSAPFTGKHESAIKNPECNRQVATIPFRRWTSSPAHTTRAWTVRLRRIRELVHRLHCVCLRPDARVPRLPNFDFFPRQGRGVWGFRGNQGRGRWCTMPRRPLAGAGALSGQDPFAMGGTSTRASAGSGSWGMKGGGERKREDGGGRYSSHQGDPWKRWPERKKVRLTTPFGRCYLTMASCLTTLTGR
jgi:hypothetical protein